MQTDVWTYRPTAGMTIDLERTDVTGFGVEALDGSIGKVDQATYDPGASQLVVDTGPWIFGRKVMLPAGVVERVDTADEKVYVDRTKEEIKHAPEYNEIQGQTDEYQTQLGSYYSGRGHR